MTTLRRTRSGPEWFVDGCALGDRPDVRQTLTALHLALRVVTGRAPGHTEFDQMADLITEELLRLDDLGAPPADST